MLYHYDEKTCLNGWWDILPVFDNRCDRTEVPSEGFLNGKYLVPSFFNLPADAIKMPGDDFYHWAPNKEDDPAGDNMFEAFDYPRTWAKLTTAYVRRTLTVDKKAGKRYFLVAEAIGPRVTLFVNGKVVAGDTEYTLPVEADVTDYLVSGENTIVYLLEDYDYIPGTHRTLWPSGNTIPSHMRGIWQDVYLVEKSDVYIEDITIRTSYRNHTMTVIAEVRNVSVADYHGQLCCKTAEYKSGLSPIADIIFDIDCPKGKTVKTEKTVVWENPELWDSESPFLYQMTCVLDGEETVHERFGFREVWIDGINLMLNGHPIHLFADWGHKTTPFYLTEAWIRKWFGMIRDHNMNYSRLHTHPHSPIHMDIADELGIYICGEAGIHGSGAGQGTDDPIFWENAERHIRRFVHRDKNHPSVILWSVENEMRWNRDKTDLAKRELPRMKKLFNEIDPTRPAYHEGDSSWWNEKDQDILSRHYGKECTGFGWWDKSAPLHSGEFCLYHYAGPNNTVHLGGDRVWTTLDRVTYYAAQDLRMVSEDARANGVCALGPWNLSCLLNLRPNEETHLTYDDYTTPGMKPLTVHANASEFEFWKDGKGYTDQPGTEANAIAFRPFAAIDLSHRTSYWGDRELKKTVTLVNDTYFAQQGEVSIAMILNGKTVKEVKQPFSLKRGEIGKYDFDLTHAYEEGRYTYRLTAVGQHGVLDVQDREIVMTNHSVSRGKAVYLLDQGLSAALLEGVGVPYHKVSAVSEVPTGEVLVIGKNFVTENSTINREIREFAVNGGRVLLLEQQVSVYPQLTLEAFPVQTAWCRGYTHPICSEIGEEEIRFWGDDPHSLLSGNTYVADRMFVKDDGRFMDVLYDAGEGGFGYGDIHYTPLFTTKEGKGIVISCQFNLSTKYDTIPAAGKMLHAILRYAEGYLAEAARPQLTVARADDTAAVSAAISNAENGGVSLITSLDEVSAGAIRAKLGFPAALVKEKYGTWNGVRTKDDAVLNGISNEDLCGIEKFCYNKENAENYRIARYVMEDDGIGEALVTTCPRAAMVPMYLFGGQGEMQRAYTATNFCYKNTEKPKNILVRYPLGRGTIYFSTFENLGADHGKTTDRLDRFERRLIANLSDMIPDCSALEGECTKANDACSEGYPKMLFAWNGDMEENRFKSLLGCTTYQVERMNPMQVLTSFNDYTTLTSDDGVWSADDCPNHQSTLLYYTIFSPVSRKNEGSNLDVPDPAAQTYLDLTGEGEVELWINSKYCGSLTLDGQGSFADLELERMFNHILFRWRPASPNGKLGMQWRNILHIPERNFRFAFTTRF